MKCSQMDWCSQQLYQELALNCKGEALAKIKALAAGGDEGTRGVTAWHGPTRDHRGFSAQRTPQRCVKMSDISSHLELWERRIREYEKLVFQTEKIQTKVLHGCKVFIVRSLVPKDSEKDLLKIHPTANCKTTREYILEQASLKRDAHSDDKGKHDKPVPMEVDALLAKVTAPKEGRGEKRTKRVADKNPTFTILVEDDPNTKKRKTRRSLWTKSGKELMALTGNQGGKGGKGGKGKGFQGYCNYWGEI